MGLEINIRLIIDIILFILFIIVGHTVILDAAKNISKGHLFDEKFLMSLASVGALALGEMPEAFAIMLFYQIGERLSDKAEDHSQKVIEDLCLMQSDKARVKKGNEFIEIETTKVLVGDLMEVRAGERVPCDGTIIKGNSSIDNSAITGESTPQAVGAGSSVLSGAINQNGILIIEAKKVASDSFAARIIDLMKNAQEKKSKSERFITKFARIYTPVVCILSAAVAVVPPIVLSLIKTGGVLGGVQLNWGDFSIWVHRALMFLVVSCPCALVISVPLTMTLGIAANAKRGVLVKSSGAIEILSKVRAALFDKTGTLTKGTFSVQDVHLSKAALDLTKDELIKLCHLKTPFSQCFFNDNEKDNKTFFDDKESKNVRKDAIIGLATHAQKYSKHPIAEGLRQSHHCPQCLTAILKDTIETAGFGIHTLLDGEVVLAGNEKLMEKHGVKVPICKESDPGTVIHIAINGIYLGHIIINDEIKSEARDALAALKKLGVRTLTLLTGDKKASAEVVAKDLDLDDYKAELLPEDKVAIAEEVRDSVHKTGGAMLFCGDGINDAPVLALSDVGVAMGALGREAAIDASDLVIMSDDLRLLPASIKSAKKAMTIVHENIAISIMIKVAIMILGATGLGSMWLAVFGDTGLSLLAILNSLRATKIKQVKNNIRSI